jgi:hypothetical protein
MPRDQSPGTTTIYETRSSPLNRPVKKLTTRNDLKPKTIDQDDSNLAKSQTPENSDQASRGYNRGLLQPPSPEYHNYRRINRHRPGLLSESSRTSLVRASGQNTPTSSFQSHRGACSNTSDHPPITRAFLCRRPGSLHSVSTGSHLHPPPSSLACLPPPVSSRRSRFRVRKKSWQPDSH